MKRMAVQTELSMAVPSGTPKKDAPEFFRDIFFIITVRFVNRHFLLSRFVNGFAYIMTHVFSFKIDPFCGLVGICPGGL